jgi:hypothetical protein
MDGASSPTNRLLDMRCEPSTKPLPRYAIFLLFFGVFALQIPVFARLHPLGFARHLRSADLLLAMLTCNYTVRGRQPCGKLSGENSPELSLPLRFSAPLAVR